MGTSWISGKKGNIREEAVDLEKGVTTPLDTSLTCRPNTSSICRQFFDLQIVLQSVESYSIYLFDLQIEYFFDLQIILQSADGVIVWSTDNSSICKWFFDLHKFLQSTDSSSVCRSNISSI